MENQQWTSYLCKSDKTFVLYNNVTGEFKWPTAKRKNPQRIAGGQPAPQRKFCSIATQTDDNGCNNGCMSMYVSNTTHTTPLHRQPGGLNKEHSLNSENHNETGLHQYVNKQGQSTAVGRTTTNQNVLVNSSDNNNKDHSDSTSTTTANQHLLEKLFNTPSTSSNIDNNYGECAESETANYEVSLEGFEDEITTVDNIENVDHNKDSNSLPSVVSRVQNDHDYCGKTQATHSVTTLRKKSKPHYECHICKEVFTLKASLNKHTTTVHNGVKNFECSYCKRKFSQQANMNSHIRLHTGVNLLECSYCKKKFYSKYKLKVHVRMHTDERPFECPYCQKKFRRKDNLNKHVCMGFKIALNGGECTKCKMKLTSTSDISKHVQMHESEQPFECSVCKRRFASKEHVSRHEKIHSKEKHKCSVCSKTFVTKPGLNHHNKSQHFNVKSFECSICDKEFCSKSALDRHKVIHTGEKPFACDFCEERFARIEYLRKHLKSHADLSSEKITSSQSTPSEL